MAVIMAVTEVNPITTNIFVCLSKWLIPKGWKIPIKKQTKIDETSITTHGFLLNGAGLLRQDTIFFIPKPPQLLLYFFRSAACSP